MSLLPDDPLAFARAVRARVPAYRALLERLGVPPEAPFEDLPLLTRQGYLQGAPVESLCWDGSLDGCHLLGASSGFSRTGTLFWPKRPQDERGYLEGIEGMLIGCYGIDRRRTLILVCLAFGTWIGGMQLATACRSLAARGTRPVTVATPGLDLAEAVELYERYNQGYEQVLWITNPSNVPLVSALLERRGLTPPPGQISFPVVGEYYSEATREWVAERFGHPPDDPFCLWTGYGSADTGGLGVETRATVALRKHLHRRPGLCRALFGSEAAPMLLAPSPEACLEEVEGTLVCTKDQLVPLVRYDTRDAGGLRSRAALLAAGVPEALAPDRVLFVHGRAADAVIFYGTNLRLSEIGDDLLGLPPEAGYGGLYEVEERSEGGVTRLLFTIHVHGALEEARRALFQDRVLGFLKGRSREFAHKLDRLSAAAGEPLVTVRLADASRVQGRIKHRTLIQGAGPAPGA